MSLFFKPADGVAADFIPFYWQGEYHLFYLKDYRDKAGHGEGTPWFHIGTRDFVHFTDYGEALPRGREDEQDLYVFTGCAMEHEGQFHIFYTGHNPHFRRQGKPEQAIMHATSPDLIQWTKDPANPILFADSRTYEPHDWRDPFVFWNAEAQQFWMLLAARVKNGPDNRRGCTAVVVSRNLQHWEIGEALWTPGLYFTHECPDCFRMGEWWYLVYSTFSERTITHYRMSRSLSGPWLAPENDSFDGRAFYAAKTASDGQRRFAFGWDPTRSDEKDTGAWNWGGVLVTHELQQDKDGFLTVRWPAEIAAQCSFTPVTTVRPQLGRWRISPDQLQTQNVDSFAWCLVSSIAASGGLSTVVTFTAMTRSCGILLGTDDLNSYYQIRLEPGRKRVVFDRWPRPGDEPFMLERPLDLAAGSPIKLTVLKEGTVIVAYINDQVALSARCYTPFDGQWGLFVSEGEATFSRPDLITTP